MEINVKSKFNLDQKVVAFDSGTKKLQNIEISEIQFDAHIVDSDTLKIDVWYRDKKTFQLFKEEEIYTSREEFIAQL